tara:strand:- start:1335 stop:1505 length:171 start_codon:yes stop_codon:yes gene_type:complete
MNKIKLISLLILVEILSSQNSYLLEDFNPNSGTYGQEVGSSYFAGKVILHYFGAFT